MLPKQLHQNMDHVTSKGVLLYQAEDPVSSGNWRFPRQGQENEYSFDKRSVEALALLNPVNLVNDN